MYDRQIRLWGLEAQQRSVAARLLAGHLGLVADSLRRWLTVNRMRSSTVLMLNLNSLAHETIKNIVLSGIGHLIVRPRPHLQLESC